MRAAPSVSNGSMPDSRGVETTQGVTNDSPLHLRLVNQRSTCATQGGMSFGYYTLLVAYVPITLAMRCPRNPFEPDLSRAQNANGNRMALAR